MDSGRHTVGSLVGKFGKSEAYILSRLKLCALIDPLADLLDREEISVDIAIEIAKYDDKIQQEVFDEHFAENCRSSWKNARIREVARRLYQRYMTQLDTYRFDKSECMTCLNNTANHVLFRDCTDGCAGCQNMDCMIRKNEAFLTQKAIDLQHNDPRIVLAADDDAPAAVIDALLEPDGWHCPIELEYGDKASYNRIFDKIVCPLKRQFPSGVDFYDTLLHEIAHSTGHPIRLNRPPHLIFGDSTYAREELVAELTAALCGAILGLAVTPRTENAACLKSWLSQMKEEPTYLFDILVDVNKAARRIIDRIEPDTHWEPYAQAA